MKGRFLPVLGVSAMLLATATFIAPTPVFAAPAPESFSGLAEKVSGAVVNISSEHKARRGQRSGREMPFAVPRGSPFEDLFRDFRERFGDRPGRGERTPRFASQGSGFIIDKAGYIVTNHHVVEGADSVRVTMTDGTQLTAKVIGSDRQTDVALIKVEATKDLPVVAFGDSDQLKVGDWVMAVGTPFGLGGTVTAGIVSARGRDIASGPYVDYLQIDAAVNQGNSGGPTFGMDGRVVGINTAIYSPNGGNVGIAFAIPANVARPVVDQLRASGQVARGWLGVQIQPVTVEIASAIGLSKPTGALVSEVMPDSPAAKAKLAAGDVIIRFDGKTVAEMRDLPRLVAAVPAGKTAQVEVWRDKKAMTLGVEIAKLQSQDVAARSRDDADLKSDTLGAALAEITPAMRQRYGIADEIGGVLIVDLDDDGVAAENGLRPGDVIREVGSVKVSTPAQVSDQIEKAKASPQRSVLVLVNRNGRNIFLGLDLKTA